MTPADRLRSLVKEATPGPWEYYAGIPPWEPAVAMTGSVYARNDYRPLAEKPRTADACLIAMAPHLAELVADMADYVDGVGGMKDGNDLLARFAALFPEDSA